jgi:hypothetical protein
VPLLIPKQTPKKWLVYQTANMKLFRNSLLIMKISLPLILLDIVKVIPTDNDGPVHLRTVACPSYDATPNRHSASEWAFLIDVGSCNKEHIRGMEIIVIYQKIQ